MYKVEAKTKSASGIDFTVNCSSNHDTKKFLGSLETKYKWSDYGTQTFSGQFVIFDIIVGAICFRTSNFYMNFIDVRHTIIAELFHLQPLIFQKYHFVLEIIIPKEMVVVAWFNAFTAG